MNECYVFDIDGTIADCQHRLDKYLNNKPKRWDLFEKTAHLDTPIEETIQILHALNTVGYRIVLCTGRGEKMREATENWLDLHSVRWDALYMRALNDFRQDDIVKGELVDNIMADGFKILGAFEDRQRVVDMWRSKGIRCYQVEKGEF